MAKNKKTRRQKTIADLKRQLAATQPPLQTSAQAPSTQSTPSRPQYTFSQSPSTIPQKTLSTVQTPHVLKDLRHTMIVTAGIVLAQIVLFIVISTQR